MGMDDQQGLATPKSKKKSHRKVSRRPSDADAALGRNRSASNMSAVSTVSVNAGTPEGGMKCKSCSMHFGNIKSFLQHGRTCRKAPADKSANTERPRKRS